MASVLVVDDEMAITELLAEFLSDMGHTTLTAANGRDALALTRSHHPQLIITDVMMPHMDGFALLDAVRADAAYATTPVILMSAAFPLQLPRNDATYVQKPFDLRVFERLVNTLFPLT